jgi:hypothetical protein
MVALLIAMTSASLRDSGLTIHPTTVYADTTESWDPGPPKGVVGSDGIRCNGVAAQDGVSYDYTNYVGADAGEMAAGRERTWQQTYCRWVLEQDMGRFFDMHGVKLDPSRIKMTIQRL